MAVSDSQLIQWLAHEKPRVRGAALDLLTGSYSNEQAILPAVFESWDRFGADVAFHDFPLISHLPIPAELVPECLRRAQAMSADRKITERTCRCAGKLIEALSVAHAPLFAAYLNDIERLKETSKIFFRISIDSMRARAEALHRESNSIEIDFEDGSPTDMANALECLLHRGEARPWIERGLSEIGEQESLPQLASVVLEFMSRHEVPGFEEALLPLVDRHDAFAADAATIALVRYRNQKVQQLIADAFPKLSRNGQLRCIDIVRRARLPKSAEFLRFLLPFGVDLVVQDSARIAEVLLFDFDRLEDWLEAYLLLEDRSVRRVGFALPLAEAVAKNHCPIEWGRIEELVESRAGRGFFQDEPTR